MKYAFINAAVLDGSENMQPTKNTAVLVEDGIIKAIEPSADSFGDVEMIDLEGRYLMPGLINLHVHLPGSGMPSYTKKQNAKTVNFLMSNIVTRSVVYSLCYKFARTQLMSGVTTIRTVGGLADFDTRLRDEIAAGRRVGPRILAANEGISVPGGHMAGSVAVAAHSIPEALAQLDAAEAQGVDLIKLMITGGVMDAKEKGVPGEMKMPPEMIKAVCDRAHAAGYRVAAHVESPQGVRAALENGVDSIEHGAKPDAEILRLFKDTGAFLCTTISPALPYALFDRSITHATEVEQYNGTIVFEGIIDCAKAALANDIPVVLGNDVGCPWITQYDFWRELFYFHKYTGVSNAFALYTATSRSAELAGIGSETGTVAPGKCADLIVTAANPLEDLRALRHVGMVMARGQLTGHPRFKRRPEVEAQLDRFLTDESGAAAR